MVQQPEIDAITLARGTDLLVKQLEDLIAQNPDIENIHNAFQVFCTNRYSLGSAANTVEAGGKNDLGIDFYSYKDKQYVVGQCKVPALDYLSANAGKPKVFGPAVVNDPRSALLYLFGDGAERANEKVKALYAHMQVDRQDESFSLNFFLLVYGRLNDRGHSAFEELKSEYEKDRRVRIHLLTIEHFAGEFVLGLSNPTGKIETNIRFNADYGILRAKGYCYFLANGGDVLQAFLKYGWRLFDLNVRYELKNSSINGDIVESLIHQKSRRRFHHYNNGLTVVAKQYNVREDKKGTKPHIHLVEPQIVNGLQTVKSLFNAIKSGQLDFQALESECSIQVKVIETGDADFVSRVVQATNNQNPMSPRNLKGNATEQKLLRAGLAAISPSWFLQVKESEWESLTDENGRFFEQIVGQPMSAFKPNTRLKRGRVLDNQDAAKAWLAFIGFADQAGDRVAHFFSDPQIYDLAFNRSPSRKHWESFGEREDFSEKRKENLDFSQSDAIQYLLASGLWSFINRVVPSPKAFREEGLNEGVKAGKIEKRDGHFTSPASVEEAFLAGNTTYQTWRLMSNMKEVLLECMSHVLVRKYGSLNGAVCESLLKNFDLAHYFQNGELTDEVCIKARTGKEFEDNEVFSRLFNLLRFATTQYWEEKQKQLLGASRLRTYLLKRDVARELKSQVWAAGDRLKLDRPWKQEGVTFLSSMPELLSLQERPKSR